MHGGRSSITVLGWVLFPSESIYPPWGALKCLGPIFAPANCCPGLHGGPLGLLSRICYDRLQIEHGIFAIGHGPSLRDPNGDHHSFGHSAGRLALLVTRDATGSKGIVFGRNRGSESRRIFGGAQEEP